MNYDSYIENDNNSYEENLDDNWIVDFEKYNSLYPEKIKKISILFLYIKNNDIIDSNNILIPIENGLLPKKKLITILLNNKKEKFKIHSILKYNIHIDSSDIENFIHDSSSYNFLYNINYLNDISFKDSIKMFHDLNQLIVVFENKINNDTKKIFFNDNNKHTRKRKITNKFKDN